MAKIKQKLSNSERDQKKLRSNFAFFDRYCRSFTYGVETRH